MASELSEITSLFTPEIVELFAEVSQSRSDYQLEKFVVNQHDTDEMRYVQTLLEIQHIYYTVKHMSLEAKKDKIKLERLRATGDEIDAIEAEQLEIGMERGSLVALGTYRELETLLKILSQFPRYTRDQIEAGQADYWNKRMHRQIETDQMGGRPSIAAHLNSLIQMGELRYVTENEKQSIEEEAKQLLGELK
jgi:hypothetical protein